MSDREKPDYWSALILSVDIVRFSERSGDDQLALVRHLVNVFREDPLTSKRSADDVYISSTGDGFIAAFHDGAFDLALEVCELARRLVVGAGECHDAEGAPLEVRVGLHKGEMTPDAERIFDGRFAVGNGMNWVARIGDLAGPGQVLVSERFVEYVKERFARPKLLNRFFPPVEKPPFALNVKHERRAEFRVLLGEGLSEAPPPKLVRLDALGGHVQYALEIVAESLVAGLRSRRETLEQATERLQPRLTLWMANEGVLRHVAPRVQLPLGEGPVPAPRTTWALPAAGEEPAGPVARAFVNVEPDVLLDLPDPVKDRKAYYARWRDLHVSAETVASFTRHARAVLVFPLQLFNPGVVGCLCCDVLDPLTGQERLVGELLETLRFRNAYFLAALLHLRSS